MIKSRLQFNCLNIHLVLGSFQNKQQKSVNLLLIYPLIRLNLNSSLIHTNSYNNDKER
jgi:hypothetical protein